MFEQDDIDLFDEKVRKRSWRFHFTRCILTGAAAHSADAPPLVSDGASRPCRGWEAGADEDEDAGAASQDERITAPAQSPGQCCNTRSSSVFFVFLQPRPLQQQTWNVTMQFCWSAGHSKCGLIPQLPAFWSNCVSLQPTQTSFTDHNLPSYIILWDYDKTGKAVASLRSCMCASCVKAYFFSSHSSLQCLK